MDFQSVASMAASAGGKNSNVTQIGARADSALMTQTLPRPPPRLR